MEIISSIENIGKSAQRFLEICGNNKVYAFRGDLGAGKTTFISSLCKSLGVEETITSPTYSIIQEYISVNNQTIYHIDLYRIKSRAEAMNTGIEDCLSSNEICMVEWPEKIPDIFPENTVFTDIEVLSDKERKLIITLPG